MTDLNNIPQAQIATRNTPYASRIWLLTAASVVLAICLVIYSSRTKGVPVIVSFQDGHGVSAGDRLKYRGIDIGEVTSVELDDALVQVNVTIDIEQAAEGISRQGSLFWIERPVVELTEVRGLETLFGGTHIAVLPGPPDAKPQREFTGLDIAPTGDLPEGGLEILLEAPRIGSLARRVPIKYRGLKIGHVLSVGLASDAATVEARAFIQPEYRHLIRTSSKFWNQSGLDFSLGITGLQVEADSLASIAFGGIEVATPSPPGDLVSTGQRFPIYDEPVDEWLTAQPNLTGSSDLLAAGHELPVPIRIATVWKERTFGIKRSHQRLGWILPLDDGRLIGPSDLLLPVKDATDEGTFLELVGAREELTVDNTRSFEGVASCVSPDEIEFSEELWLTDQIRVPQAIEDCLLVAGSGAVQVLSEARLSAEEDNWQINMATPIDTDLHGASVIAVSDGKLVGFLVFEDGKAIVATIRSELLSTE